MEITRNPNDHLLISHPKSTLDMSDAERFKYYIKLTFPIGLVEKLLPLYPDFDVKYRKDLINLYQDRRVFSFFHGPVGTGKTFSAIVCLLLALKGRWRVLNGQFYFLQTSSFFLELQQNINNYKYYENLNQVKNCSFLILDDLGIYKFTEWNISIIDDIINYRYLNKFSTIITSNWSLQKLAENGLSRVVSRIGEQCGPDRIFEFQENLRNTESLKGRVIA